MKRDVLRCTTVEGVRKDLCIFAVVYNLVRRVMAAAAQRQKVTIDRIGFIDAWRWLQEGQAIAAVSDWVVNPQRRGCCEPRVRKRRPKGFPLMNKPRAELRKT